MAAKAFVLIETEVGKTKEVASALKRIAGVESADPVTGAYDVIAVVEEKGPAEIGDLLISKIRSTPGIHRIVTCLT